MQVSKLIVFSLLLLSCQYLYLQQGLSAIVIILTLAAFLTAIKLLSFHQQSKKQIIQVINALANNDPTLGLTHSDPLSEKLAQLRDQIQHESNYNNAYKDKKHYRKKLPSQTNPTLIQYQCKL